MVEPAQSPAPTSEPDATPPAAKPPRPRRKRRWLRWTLGIAGVLLLLLVILAAFLPTILSGPGKGYILATVNEQIRGTLTVERLKLGWTGQELQGVVLRDAQGNLILQATRLALPDASLLELATGSKSLGDVLVDVEQLHLTRDRQGNVNLLQALSAPVDQPARRAPREPSERRSTQLPTDLSGHIQLRIAHATLTSPDIEPAELENVQANLNLPSLRDFTLSLQADTRFAGQAGRIDVPQLAVANLIDEQGFVRPVDQIQLQGQGEIRDLPVHVVDFAVSMLQPQPETAPVVAVAADDAAAPAVASTALADLLLGSRGTMASLVGPSLNASFQADGSLAQGTFGATLNSETLDARLALAATEGVLRIPQGESTYFRATLTPQAWRERVPMLDEGRQPELARNVRFDFTVDRLLVPRQEGSVNLAAARGEARLTVSDIEIDSGRADVGRVAIRDTRMDFTAATLGEDLRLALQTRAEQQGQVGTASLTAGIFNLLQPDGTFNRSQLRVEADGAVRELPLAPFDELLPTNGMLVAALDRTLEASLSVDLKPTDDGAGGTYASGPFSLEARSPRLDARIQGRLVSEGLHIETPEPIRWRVEQPLAQRLLGDADEQGRMAQLVEPVMVQLAIEHLTVPRGGPNQRLALAEARAAVRLTSGDVRLVRGQDGPVFGFTQPRMALTSPRFGDEIGLSVTMGTFIGDRQGEVDYRSTLSSAVNGEGDFVPSAGHLVGRLALRDIPVALADALGGTTDLATAVLGEQLNLTAQADLRPAPDKPLPEGPVSLTINAANLEAQLNGQVADGALVTGPETQAALRLSREAFNTLARQWEIPRERLYLTDTATLTAVVGQLHLPLTGDLWSGMRFDVTAGIDRLAFEGEDLGGPAVIRDVRLTTGEAALSQPMTVELNAAMEHANQSGRVHARARVADPLASWRPSEMSLRVSGMPVTLAAAVTQQDVLVAALGPRLREIDLDLTPAPEGDTTTFAGRIASDRLEGTLGGLIDRDGTIRFTEGINLALVVTPETYRTLLAALWGRDAEEVPEPGTLLSRDYPAEWHLVERFTLTALITEALVYPAQPAEPVRREVRLGPGSASASASASASGDAPAAQDEAVAVTQEEETGFDMRRVTFVAKVNATDLIFRRSRDDTNARLTGLSADVDARKPGETVSVEAGARLLGLRDAQGQPLDSEVGSQTRMSSLLDQHGQVDLSQAVIQTQTRVDPVPTALAVDMLELDPRLPPILGPEVSLTLGGDYPGNLDLILQSPNVTVNVEGLVTQDRVLALRSDGRALMEVTPELSRTLLTRFSPALLGAVDSEGPIRLIVEDESLAVPLGQFDLSKVRARGALEIGTLHFGDDALVAPVLRMLGVEKYLDQPLQFTPLRFEVADGVLTYRDFSLTVGDIRLAFEGQIDQVQDVGRHTMYVPASTLTGAIKELRGVLGEGDRLAIPITGPISQPQLDMQKLQRELVELTAKAGLRQGLGELGEEGEAAGSILDMILQGRQRRPEQPAQPEAAPEEEAGEGQPAQPEAQEQPRERERTEPLNLLFQELQRQRERKEREEQERRQRREERQRQREAEVNRAEESAQP